MQKSDQKLPETVLAPYRGKNSAIVTMLLRDGATDFESYGSLAQSTDVAPEDMIFEIGSITKVFTSILLAVLVEEGKIDPDQPVKDVVAGLGDVPDRITFQSLATHTSGLPRIHMPIWKALIRGLPDDPYAAFSRDDLIDWFRERKGAAAPKRLRHAYSNLGCGLLGEAIAMAEGAPYMDLLTQKVIAPLGLVDTTSVLTDAQQARFMQPFSAKDKPVAPWTFQAIAGAGCLRSSARDLSRFSSRVLGALANPHTPLDRAIRRSTEPLVGLGPRGKMEPRAQCLGWFSIKLKPDAPRMLFHNGGTAGATSALYICPKVQSAALVMANKGVAAGLWSSLKLEWSNPDRAMSDLFASIAKTAASPAPV